jgi:DNA-binding response OmpR family regulator
MSQKTSQTILVVEDQSDLRQFVCRVLEKDGHHALAAGQALPAFELIKARAGAVDLVIVDMVLPGPSGLDLASWLDRDFPAISILYISGHVDSIAMECIAHRSPDCVLLKPFTPSQLVARVNLLLSSVSKKGPGVSPEPQEKHRSGSGSGD